METEYDELIAFCEQEIPFNVFMGIRVDELQQGMARLLLPFKPELLGDTRRPALHGGVISTLIDTSGGMAVWTHCRTGDAIATIDIRVDYLRPGPSQDILAESRVRLMGSRVGSAQTILYPVGDREHVIAEGRAVYNIRRR
jgi:uncharacterized protein (TIGR00369 family)